MTTELKLGDLIADKYRLERPLGEGAWGAVWRAQQRGLKRTVAIKFLKNQKQELGADRRFEREAKVLARLDHPNCVMMYDYGNHEGQKFLVTEYLEGETMHDWLREERDLVEILQVIWQLLDALAHAHSLNVIHRDLKPGNVMICRGMHGELVVKVLDFGISRMAGEKRGDITKTGELIGTPGFMSPEQLSGQDAIGPPSDLYALGVILYRAFERQPPFKGRTPIEAALKHLTHMPPRVRREDVPEPLRDLVAKLLQKEPADRYPTARAVQMVLREIQLGNPPPVEEDPEPATRREPIVPTPEPPSVDESWSGPKETPRLPAMTDPAEAEQEGPPAPPDTVPSPAPFLEDRQTMPEPAQPWPPNQDPSGVRPGFHTRPPAMTMGPEPQKLSNVKLWGIVGVLVLVIGGLLAFIVSMDSDDPEPSNERISSALRSGNALVKGNEPAATSNVVADLPDLGPPAGTPGCGGFDYKPGAQKLTKLEGVFEQTATVYIPEGYDPERPYPVLMALHDTLQPPGMLLEQTGFQAYADRDGVVIVLPMDIAPLDAWHTRSARGRALDEFEFVSRELCLDPSRVYLYGHGSGGYAAETFACEMTGVTGLAVSAHRLAKSDEPCDHKNIPYMLLAPLKDNRDPVDGSKGCLGGKGYSLAEHEAIYQKIHRCSGAPEETFNHRHGTCHTWDCETKFESCQIDGGRPLPGGAGNIPCEGDAVDFPYGERIWNFFDFAGSK